MEQRILKSLLSPSAYPEPTTSVYLVQTHVSFIFITDNFVYKVKKSVDFGFLNFTTLEGRRFYCNEEVRLNRRLCPSIYLGVVELRETACGAAFCGEGKVVDYAVKMKRLPEERMLDRLVLEEKVSDDDIRRIAGTIAQFHLHAERNREIDSYGSTESIRRNWEENFQQLAESATATIAVDDLKLIREWVDRFVHENEEVFNNRISGGFIKDCDGDIHMGNICLTDDVVIFDCIEFNNRFRYSDTAADIAFLLMDFDYQEMAPFTDVFLSEYIAITGDLDINQVLTFYKVYRAVVRGKVESFRLHDPDIQEEGKEAAKKRAIGYLRLARGYIIRDKLSPSLFITCGLMGSGKSTIARMLAVELGIYKFSSDQIRKELSHVPKYTHFYSEYGTGIYDATVDEKTYGELLSRAEQAMADRRSVVIDAAFHRKRNRIRFQQLAQKHSVPFYIIEPVCSQVLSQQRLDKRLQNPREVSDGRWELFLKQKEDFEQVDPDEQHHFYLDTSRSLYDTVDDVYKELGIL